MTARLRALGRDWGQVAVPLRCLVRPNTRVTQPFAMTTAGSLDLTVSAVRFASPAEGLVDCR